MIRYIVVGASSGVLFGLMDGFAHANPAAQRLYEVYKPIARTAVNAPAGIIIDLIYGFVVAAVFLLLYKSLPGQSGVAKGLSFALLVWFFRTVMYAASQWMMFNVPVATLGYMLAV